jgi:hypothetical protein
MVMAVPRELVAAVAQAYDRELTEPDGGRRAELLALTRRILDGWLRGSVSTPDAVAALARGPLH